MSKFMTKIYGKCLNCKRDIYWYQDREGVLHGKTIEYCSERCEELYNQKQLRMKRINAIGGKAKSFDLINNILDHKYHDRSSDKANKRCAYDGCEIIVSGRSRYCQQHKVYLENKREQAAKNNKKSPYKEIGVGRYGGKLCSSEKRYTAYAEDF